MILAACFHSTAAYGAWRDSMRRHEKKSAPENGGMPVLATSEECTVWMPVDMND